MTAVATRPGEARLLAGLVEAGGTVTRLDLEHHLRRHGPLQMGTGREGAGPLAGLLADAGLNGRGGAGFPTSRKVETLARLRRRPVVVVNAMEGEPASRKDHVLATQAPHLVLDGAQVLARALGAVGVLVCVAQEHRAAAASYQEAVAERSRAGLRGVPAEVVTPPGRYVGGEESALVSWLDGGEGLPAFRPDRPAILKVGGRPVLVDNAETVANVALIARHGAAWFRTAGTPRAPGTSLVTVSGAVGRPRVVEVPFGIPVAAVLAAAGQRGPVAGVLLGGYGGTWIAGADAGTPYDPEALAALGATTGVGVMVALPEGACGLAETARIAWWMAGESAGQCGPCVFGLPSVAQDLMDLANGVASPAVMDRAWARMDVVAGRGACNHPDGVVRMARSALRAFSHDASRHVAGGPCPGAHRPSVLTFPVQREGDRVGASGTREASSWR